MINETLQRVGQMLIERNLTLAFAESATAGRLCSEFSLVNDAGNFLMGGIACYDASIKENLLNVDSRLIKKFSPESMEVTKAITEGLGQLLPASILIGITGLTCPGGSESKEKPVGTMFIYAIKEGNRLFSERISFSGDRENIVAETINRTAVLLEQYLTNK
ncbi:nicotinamide-nucleotide amidohydrolase family protein [Pedobacter aquatilis]|uniref:CinA family protein n=1 Tax=Pedobacter aquatilis TaxID=351343 RepID=UPI0025B5D8E9|nr:nicotinamide-nucleotide amidohydrolase family protein [Pedobacter aquatilis]MDN3585978.1 nicotinamide-nucleotide amidohydrolase family protein [Pedobacter aquatilis]